MTQKCTPANVDEQGVQPGDGTDFAIRWPAASVIPVSARDIRATRLPEGLVSSWRCRWASSCSTLRRRRQSGSFRPLPRWLRGDASNRISNSSRRSFSSSDFSARTRRPVFRSWCMADPAATSKIRSVSSPLCGIVRPNFVSPALAEVVGVEEQLHQPAFGAF